MFASICVFSSSSIAGFGAATGGLEMGGSAVLDDEPDDAGGFVDTGGAVFARFDGGALSGGEPAAIFEALGLGGAVAVAVAVAVAGAVFRGVDGGMDVASASRSRVVAATASLTSGACFVAGGAELGGVDGNAGGLDDAIDGGAVE